MKLSKALFNKFAEDYDNLSREIASLFLKLSNENMFMYGPWEEVNYSLRKTPNPNFPTVYFIKCTIYSKTYDIILIFYYQKSFDQDSLFSEADYTVNIHEGTPDDNGFVFQVKDENMNTLINKVKTVLDQYLEGGSGGDDSDNNPVAPVNEPELVLTSRKK